MINFKIFNNLRIMRKLWLAPGAKIELQQSGGAAPVEIDLAEIAAVNSIGAADLAKIDDITNGTAAAGKAIVLDSNKDATGIRNLSGTAAAQGVDFTLTGGTSSTSGNAGGAAKLKGGAPGATGVGGKAQLIGAAGGATSGSGGAAEVTGGDGTAGNANGGSVVLTPGAKNGSGANGCIIDRGVKLVNQGAPTAKTTSATLTAAEVLAGIITVNQGAAGASALQLPDASTLDTALPDAANNDAFDFSVINISTVDAEDASLTTNTGWTLVGSMNIPAFSTSTNASLNSSGRFRARRTSAANWTLYRMA